MPETGDPRHPSFLNQKNPVANPLLFPPPPFREFIRKAEYLTILSKRLLRSYTHPNSLHVCQPNPEKLNWSLCAEEGGARLVFFKSF